jgi:uncharacterized protein YqeY
MGLREQFTESMKDAMKAKDQKRLGTIRMVQAAIKDKDIAARTAESREGISDDDILSLLGKMIKQREESAAVYDQGNRPELAQNERDEIMVIRSYMPKQMSAEEMLDAARKAIAETGASTIKDMGKVMGAMKSRYAGQMDFGKANGVIKDLLTAK